MKKPSFISQVQHKIENCEVYNVIKKSLLKKRKTGREWKPSINRIN